MSEAEFNKVFAKRLKHYLSLYDMSQKDLAKLLNVSATAVSNWINGTKSARMDKVDLMCKIFNCKRSDLMEDKSDWPDYYTDEETARLAQEMYEDSDMRSLFHMKRNMNPDDFKIHVNYMKQLYKREHPDYDEGC